MKKNSPLWNVYIADPALLAKGYLLDAFLYPNRVRLELPKRLEWTRNDLWHNLLFAVCLIFIIIGLFFGTVDLGKNHGIGVLFATIGVYVFFCLVTCVRSRKFLLTQKQ